MKKLLLYCAILLSCNKAHISENCNSNKPFVAEFKVGENLFGYGFTETDTIIKFGLIAESAGNYTSYEWHIGNDTNTFHNKTVGLNFTRSQVGMTMPVTLIASGTSTGSCKPALIQKDTVQKNITILYPKGFGQDSLFDPQYVVTLPILGKWHGSFNDNPIDTFTVYIVNNGPINTPDFTTKSFGIRVYNLPKGCGGDPITGICGFTSPTIDYYGYPSEVSYKSFYIEDAGFASCCPKAKIFGKINTTNYNEIEIDCSFITFINGIEQQTKRIFKGTRI